MSSPVVDTVRNVPLMAEHGGHNAPMEFDEISGFPFDRDPDRDGHFRSQLDDIAKRHPEFAEHLGNLRTGGVRRQSSLGGADEPDFQTHRRFQRPFGSRFDRFGFPFDRDDFDPEQYAQQFYQENPEFHQQQPSSYSQQQPEYPQAEQQQPQAASSSPPDPDKDRSNIQQSNTIDLGQKQEPVNDRSQRSMSAPPPEKGQRFTSSINIPVNQPEEMAQTQPQQQSNVKTTERIIPIHVEDRDEPVMPRKAAPTYSQPHSTFGGSPQPETIFGRRPEEFSHFVNREPRQYEKWHSGFNHPDEFIRQQRFPQQQNVPPPQQQQQQQSTPKSQSHPKGEIPIPVQVEVPHTKQNASQRAASPQPPQQHAAPPPQPQQQKPAPQQPKKPLTPLEQIEAIQKDVAALAAQVQQFAGKPKDKHYLYLDEMLTRNLLKLDNIDTQGQDDIRTARKEAIRNIEKTIGVLEANAAANIQPAKAEEKMEVEKPQENDAQIMEAEPLAGEAHTKSEEGEQQPMDLVPESPANAGEAVQDAKEEVNQSSAQEPKPDNDSKPAENAEDATQPAPVIENRAVLVENKAEPVENRAVLVEKVAAAEESKMETCEGQESNLAVADAVRKFENSAEAENKPEDKKEPSQEGDEKKTEDKKGKKKGKKKVEKKEN